jgi:hypothetical protein
VSNKAGGWLHHSRCPHSHEDRAFVQCAEDAIHLEGQFAEPADMRSNPAAAVAARKLGWRIIGVCVVKGRSAAPLAAAPEEFPVHVDNALRSRLLVKVVHVLGAEEQALLQLLFELSQREVRRVEALIRPETYRGAKTPWNRLQFAPPIFQFLLYISKVVNRLLPQVLWNHGW